VPEISRFFGIIIRMFMEAGARAQRRLVEAWAELHLNELKADWERLQAGRPALPIAPLQ